MALSRAATKPGGVIPGDDQRASLPKKLNLLDFHSRTATLYGASLTSGRRGYSPLGPVLARLSATQSPLSGDALLDRGPADYFRPGMTVVKL